MTEAAHPSEDDLIPDPKSYWEMAQYSTRVMAVLMMLRHLYECPMAVKWLTLPQHLLGGRIPAEMLQTIDGMREVEALIARITEGAFS